MAKTSVVWDGLHEYMDELRKLPDECKAEAGKAIEGGVNSAYVAIATVYERHRDTGTLRNRLTIRPRPDGLVLTSASPIAWLFDNGSQARHWKSGKSTGTMWGRTPPTHIFSRTVGKTRRQLAQQYKDMLLRRGAVSVTET